MGCRHVAIDFSLDFPSSSYKIIPSVLGRNPHHIIRDQPAVFGPHPWSLRRSKPRSRQVSSAPSSSRPSRKIPIRRQDSHQHPTDRQLLLLHRLHQPRVIGSRKTIRGADIFCSSNDDSRARSRLGVGFGCPKQTQNRSKL